MAIDLKAILGDTKSSIMSPSEIAQLGLRRKQMKMQQENIEFQKQNSLLSTIENAGNNATSQDEFNRIYMEANNLAQNITDPTLKAKHEIMMSSIDDEYIKFNDFQNTVMDFNKREQFERDQLLGVDSTDWGLGQINDKVWDESSNKWFNKSVNELSEVENIQMMAHIARNKDGLNPRKWDAWTTTREGMGDENTVAGQNFRDAYNDVKDLNPKQLEQYINESNLSDDAIAQLRKSFKLPEDRKKAFATIMAESSGDHSAKGENKGKNLDVTDLHEGIQQYTKITNKLSSEQYAKFMTPELASEFNAKNQHFAMIGEALVTNNMISPEEWQLINQGDLKAFQTVRDNKIKALDGQYKEVDGDIGKLENALSSFMQKQAISEEDGMALNQLLGLGEGASYTKEDYINHIAEDLMSLRASKEMVNEQYKVWSGVSKIPLGQEAKKPGEPPKEKFKETLDPDTGEKIDYEGETFYTQVDETNEKIAATTQVIPNLQPKNISNPLLKTDANKLSSAIKSNQSKAKQAQAIHDKFKETESKWDSTQKRMEGIANSGGITISTLNRRATGGDPELVKEWNELRKQMTILTDELHSMGALKNKRWTLRTVDNKIRFGRRGDINRDITLNKLNDIIKKLDDNLKTYNNIIEKDKKFKKAKNI